MELEKINFGAWSFYINKKKESELHTDKCGKWMYFFDGSKESIEFVKNICEKAVRTEAVIEAKHTHEEIAKNLNSGVCCFYCNGSDIDAHKKIISFFLQNGMIKKTKTGKLYNISFKYDTQTHDGKYGAEFESKIKLKDFLNLETGEWLKQININV